MPVLYRVRCEQCGGPAEPPTDEFPEGLVLHPAQDGGLLVAGEARGYLAEDDRLVPLPHPKEADRLRELGTGWSRAAARGRLLRVKSLICRDCGAIDRDVSTTHISPFGCLTGVILGFAAYIGLRAGAGMESDVPWLVAYGILLLPNGFLSLLVSLRYRERTRSLGPDACRRCESRRFVRVAQAKRETFPCPDCGKTALKVTFGGRSSRSDAFGAR